MLDNSVIIILMNIKSKSYSLIIVSKQVEKKIFKKIRATNAYNFMYCNCIYSLPSLLSAARHDESWRAENNIKTESRVVNILPNPDPDLIADFTILRGCTAVYIIYTQTPRLPRSPSSGDETVSALQRGVSNLEFNGNLPL